MLCINIRRILILTPEGPRKFIIIGTIIINFKRELCCVEDPKDWSVRYFYNIIAPYGRDPLAGVQAIIFKNISRGGPVGVDYWI